MIAWVQRCRTRLDQAVAFGDNPAGNDEPLTRFDPHGSGMGMPFVSVAGTMEECPARLLERHVGGFEYGTAAVVRRITDALLELSCPAHDAQPGGLREVLDSVLDDCRGDLAIADKLYPANNESSKL
jgi:hypothetical protein